MSTADAFLRTIRENPDDNTARLVFADWLDENDRPERAEFIRLQIELERTPKDDPRRVEIQRREAELFADFAEEWVRQELGEGMTPEGSWSDRDGRNSAFHRGMPARVATPLPAFQSCGGALANLPPLELHITGLDRDELRERRTETAIGRVEQLAACPALANVTRLNLQYNRITPTGLERLLDSPHLGPLRELAFGPDQYGQAGGELLAQCERLSELRMLNVGSCRVGLAGLAALLASPFLRALDDVNLSGSELHDDGFARLARHEPMRNWRALDLSYNGAGLPGVRALLTSPHLTAVEVLNLSSQIPQPRMWLGDALAREIIRVGLPPTVRRLDLHSSRFTPGVVAELVQSGRLDRLTELNLGLNAVGAIGAEALARAPLTELETLRLYKTELDDEAAGALAATQHLRPRHLSVGMNAIGPNGMAALAGSRFLSRLVALELYENPLGDAGAVSIAVAPWLVHLWRLELSSCRIESAGIEALAAAPGLGGIVTLGLRGNHVGDEGAIALAASPYTGRLRLLDLRDARIGDAGANALARSPHLNCLRELRLSSNRIGQRVLENLRERFGPALVFEKGSG